MGSTPVGAVRDPASPDYSTFHVDPARVTYVVVSGCEAGPPVPLSRRQRVPGDAVPSSALQRPALHDDSVAFARGLLAGAFGPADLDPAHPHYTGWLARACAFLGTLGDEHKAWLRRARELDPRAYPDALLLPADEGIILAALDAVMRRE